MTYNLEGALGVLLSREYSIEELQGDMVLAERVKTVRQYVQASTRLVVLQRLLEATQAEVSGPGSEAFFALWIDELKAEAVGLGDRLLQLSVSTTEQPKVN